MTSTQTVDGRSARAQRTRDSVVDAVLDLVTTGQTRPTAREIADAAGISVRSVYVHFDDLDDLFRAAADRHLEQMASLLQPVDATLDLEARVAASTDQRIQIHERFGAVRRAAEQWAPQSPALADVLRQARLVGRQDIERLFGTELSGRADHDTTLSAITLLLGAEAWDSVRSQGLSVGAAREVVVHAVTRMLEEACASEAPTQGRAARTRRAGPDRPGPQGREGN
jgi:TetR/AcrR family transcriptional regulator of autoinduction and epiphytic fitness